MTTQSDWTKDIVAYGDSRNWRPLPSRGALKKFAASTRTERRDGIAADRALRLGYAALAKATPEQRAACVEWTSVLDLQRSQRAAAKEEQRAAAADIESRVSALRSRRVWALAGLFLGDQTISRYTLEELEAWRDWAAYFRFRNPTVYVHAVDGNDEPQLSLDWSAYFEDVCCEPGTQESENMTQMAADLAEFVNKRRHRLAGRN